jgi:hypothetical protein
LPGILQSGLWSALDALGPDATRAVVSDVGNDILYDTPAEQLLAWVEETIERLQRVTADVTLTGLPIEGMSELSPVRFVLFRSLFVPSCRLSLAQAAERALAVQRGLEALAAKRRTRFVRLRREWYGLDPIHIRPTSWTAAWREILGASAGVEPVRRDWPEAVRLYAARPERMRVLGVERRRAQPAYERGVRLSLY